MTGYLTGGFSPVSRRGALAGLLVLSACASVATTSEQTHPTISEEMFVSIGGIEQWITIHGTNRDNPVILFLHGGPGVPLSPTAEAMFGGWEQDFTLVQWDQRGGGRTFGKNPSTSAVTIERMVEDGVEVAAFLTQHLNKQKIIILGSSWGSILGIYMAHQRPDLFYAFIGQSQVISLHDQRNDAAAYARTIAAARAAGNQRAIDTLARLAPPWRFGGQWRGYRSIAQPYEDARITAAPAPTTMAPLYSTPEERAQNAAGAAFSLNNFFGSSQLGPLFGVDLASLGFEFQMPIFMIQGEEDAINPPEMVRAYFERLDAPRKRFYLIPGAGHGYSAPQIALTRRILLEEVRPLTRAVR